MRSAPKMSTGDPGKLPDRASAEPQEFAERIVYSALFGGYEKLREQPLAGKSDLQFVCFTDNPSLVSETWDVRLVEPAFPLDSVRSARYLKIMGHSEFKRSAETLWVDNRVELSELPEVILDEWLSDADIALFEHSFRELVLDEFSAVVEGGFDDPSRVYEQLIHYAETMPAVLERKPLWTGMMARRWNEDTVRVMRTWMDHVLRYSRRDQLSLPAALHDSEVRLRTFVSNNRRSRWHSWPAIDESLGRVSDSRSIRFEHAIRAPLARLRDVEGPVKDLNQALLASAEAREELITKLRRDIQRGKREIADLKNSRSYKLARRFSVFYSSMRRLLRGRP